MGEGTIAGRELVSPPLRTVSQHLDRFRPRQVAQPAPRFVEGGQLRHRLFEAVTFAEQVLVKANHEECGSMVVDAPLAQDQRPGARKQQGLRKAEVTLATENLA